jgi:hypothetical protein
LGLVLVLSSALASIRPLAIRVMCYPSKGQSTSRLCVQFPCSASTDETSSSPAKRFTARFVPQGCCAPWLVSNAPVFLA